MSASEREFAFLLKAAFKKVYEGADVSAELLQQEGLYKNEPVNSVRGLLLLACNVLRQAGYAGEMSDEALAKTKLNAEQRGVFKRFWAQQKGAAHAVLAEKSRFQNRLESFEWRVDSKMVGEEQLPTAIVELEVGGDKSHFEMSLQQLDDVIATLDKVKECVAEAGEIK